MPKAKNDPKNIEPPDQNNPRPRALEKKSSLRRNGYTKRANSITEGLSDGGSSKVAKKKSPFDKGSSKYRSKKSIKIVTSL
jgi:hypothetical protein